MGPNAGSEPEVKNVMNYLSKIKHNIKFHQSLHAYSQKIIFPWGYRSKNDTTDTNGNNDNRLNMKHSVYVWSKRVDACSVFYILSLASLTVTQAVLEAKYTVIGNSF